MSTIEIILTIAAGQLMGYAGGVLLASAIKAVIKAYKDHKKP